MFEVEWSDEARTKFSKLDAAIARAVERKVARLQDEPDRLGRRLQGMQLWSLRVGKLRVLYAIDFTASRVFVVTLGPRKSVYDRL